MDHPFVLVEYATLVTAFALLASTLSGSYGQNVAAVFASSGAGAKAAAKAARSQGVPAAGARAAYRRAPYSKPALKYLYALGWVGGTKNRSQCGLTSIAQDAARQQVEREIRSNRRLLGQLRKRAVSVRSAATALVRGVVSACP